eukprot:Phypoly_transcript_05936.p1 GENE.Phypoly_transcript_05936~~Phypoly_transcript_05936.p1  ORF type:complete len:258 (-),score=11.88 Phypoly_transcript_05936:539-1312(-)
MTEVCIFHVPTCSWKNRGIKGSGPIGCSISCFAFISDQNLLACIAQVKSGFYLYFLDILSCKWTKLIKCTDMEARLLPNPQLLCDGVCLFVLLTSAAGNLHFLCVDSTYWQLHLVPICGNFPYENARSLLSLSMHFPWKGTLLAFGVGQECADGKLSQHGKAVHVYMLRHDTTSNTWEWSPNHSTIMDSGPVVGYFIHGSQLVLATQNHLHLVDVLTIPPTTPSPTQKHKRLKKMYEDQFFEEQALHFFQAKPSFYL